VPKIPRVIIADLTGLLRLKLLALLCIIPLNNTRGTVIVFGIEVNSILHRVSLAVEMSGSISTGSVRWRR